MRFFNNSVSSLLVGALLATSAAAGVIRSPGAESDSILSPEKRAWMQKRADDCAAAQQRSRRSVGGLMARNDPEDLDMDSEMSARGDQRLITFGMTTCVGIAVVGDLPPDTDADDRFMGHVAAGDDEGVVEKMKTKITDAKGKGLSNIRWEIVYPAPDSLEEEQEEQKADNEAALNGITEAVGAPPNQIHEHDVKHGFDLIISGSKMIAALDAGEVDDGEIDEDVDDRKEELEDATD